MTREELESMEGFASILSERLEEVTNKYEDIDDLVKYLDEGLVRDIYRDIRQMQEEYNELNDKLSDLTEAVEEFTKEVRSIKEKALQ